MKHVLRGLICAVTITIMVTAGIGYSYSQPAPGKTAPAFKAKDIKGKTHDLSKMKDRSMLILYFFDVESRSSQEGMLDIDKLSRKYKGADMNIWGVTLSSEEEVQKFVNRVQTGFPVILDESGISDLYNAKSIL